MRERQEKKDYREKKVTGKERVSIKPVKK